MRMAIRLQDPAKAQHLNIAANVWVARIIPVLLAGVVGYATYVLVVVLCVHYLLNKHDNKSAPIPILVVYFILFLLMATSFFRLVYITTFDPPLVPLGPSAVRDRKANKRGGKEKLVEDGIGRGEYDSRHSSGDTTRNGSGSQHDPDSPGLELFYTKDVFVCELDGKPRWCSECANWKPDRAHHCSTNGRCIMKMDHFCPWVGGPVGENNMKFFIQFNGYTALYCLHLLIVMAIFVAKQKSNQDESINAQLVIIIGLAGFFFSFTAGMASSSSQLAMRNMTQVEHLGAKTRIRILAVIKPPRAELDRINPALASQPPYAEITYPLGSGVPPPPGRSQEPGVPSIKTNSHAGQWHPSPVAPRLEEASQDSTLPSSESSHFPPAIDPSNAPANFPIVSSAQIQPIAQSNAAITCSPATPGLHAGYRVAAVNDRRILSDRDLQATRTFAILSMQEVGQNPWDLGTRLLNFKTVMGNSVIDWFLPVKRSPCCNHEDTTSHFAIGPNVESVRRDAGFIDGTAQAHQRRRRKHRNGKYRTEGTNGVELSADMEMDKIKNGRAQDRTGMDESVGAEKR